MQNILLTRSKYFIILSTPSEHKNRPRLSMQEKTNYATFITRSESIMGPDQVPDLLTKLTHQIERG